jgi:outer membrane lipoprotein SlyB
LAAAAMVLCGEGRATAQYIYQPAPDYYHNDTASGTFMGGALGAITGAVVGGKKNRGEGALIGAGVGAVTGNLLGRSKDRNDERRAAVGAATVGQLNQQAAQVAVTNYDLLEMTRAGVSEEVIISTMRSRGARIDLSPQSLIALKQQGVSDRVVMAAQDMSGGRGYLAGAPAPVAVVREVPATRVYVAPAPCYYDRWHHWHHWDYHHHHHHPRSHGHISVGF